MERRVSPAFLARFAFDKLRLTLLRRWRRSLLGVTLSLPKGDATHWKPDAGEGAGAP